MTHGFRTSLFRFASVGALAWAGSAGVAHAQQETASANLTNAPIIVTAQLREEDIQDVPIAITALTSDDLAAARIEDSLDLQFNAPNVILSANRNLTIRGVGSQSFGGSNDTNIGILINGVFLQQGSTFGEFFDLERIEVLRGPQGTLFGRNTTGGAINFVSRRPTDEFEGYVSLQLESFEGIRAEGAINIPIADGISQRFAAHYLKRDGYTENLFDGGQIDGRDQYTLRSSTRFEPSDTTTIDLVLTYFEEDSNRANAVKTLCTPDPAFGCSPNSVDTDFPAANFPIDNALIGGIVRADTFGPNPTDLRTVNIDVLPTQHIEDFLATLEINQEIGAVTLTSVTGYRDGSNSSQRDFDQGIRPNAFNPGDFVTPFGPLTVPDNGAGNGVLTYLLGPGQQISSTDWRSAQYAGGFREQFSQELRLATDLDGAFNFLIGGYYLHATGGGFVDTYMPANRTFGFVASGNTTNAIVDSYAVFGEVYIDLTDNLSILGGLRYTQDDKEITTASGSFALPPPFNGEASFDAVTGRAAIEWEPADNVNLYASYSRGFKSGGFNPGNAVNPTFDSEFIDSYEVGAKTELFDNTLTLNAALFRYDYSNLIVGNIVGTLATNVNIPASRVQGFELETVWTPVPELRFEAALGLLDTEIRSSFLSSDPARGQAFFQIQGNELPNAPERTLKLAGEYTIDAGDGWTVRPRIDFYSQTGFFSREFNVPADRVGAWEQFDASIQIANEDRQWDLTLFVKNLFNQDSITFLETNSNLVGSFRSAFLLDPRVFGASLQVGF
ncbi:TonB-dependent receptor [Parasphingopyxis sp.]|uniref:TonB-dependent receptor n=1 Tax=Parasphingopyxis sp. TaxID=1920299 RepID=UPI00261165C2|nr:TonB-dependent receptor [Parasphingopyxis sp.]